MLKVVKAKKYQLRGKMTNKRFKISPEWQLLICGHAVPKINRNPLLSMQSCTSSSKYLSYLVLWDLFLNFIVVFGGILAILYES